MKKSSKQKPNVSASQPAFSQQAPLQNIKLVVIGDPGVGKTSVIVSYHEDGLPNHHLPMVYDNISKYIRVNNINIQLGLWDVSTHEDYDRLRPLSYPRTDVFLLMYDISDKQSLNNLQSKWKPEKEQLLIN